MVVLASMEIPVRGTGLPHICGIKNHWRQTQVEQYARRHHHDRNRGRIQLPFIVNKALPEIPKKVVKRILREE